MEEDKGLKSLLKRQEAGEISICLTDESQKIVVVEREIFLAMGAQHTKNDQEVDMRYVEGCADIYDCHSSMWSKVTGVGRAKGQEARVRESYQGGLCAPAMYPLVKDHKPPGPDGIPKTRPVVGGNVGYAVGLTEQIADVLEPVWHSLKGKAGVISTDDMLGRFEVLKAWMREKGAKLRRREQVTPETQEPGDLCLIATDVEALFPSLEAGESGRICKEVIENGDLDFEEIDLPEALLYLRMNRTLLDKQDLEQLEDYLPVRKFQGGKEPGMTGGRVRGPNKVGQVQEKDEKWEHKCPPTGAAWRKKIVGMMAQVGVQVAFRHYCYTFGGRLYHQLRGGPIGDRLTMIVALLVMEHLWREFRKIVEASGREVTDEDREIFMS